MADNAEERTIRLASIVSVDIVGFSAMSERDQRNAARKVEGLRARIETIAATHKGRLFNTAGDGFMLEFASAGAALGAVQDLLDKRAKGEPAIRVGAHVGDVVVTGTNDLLGHGVNVAARLQELAGPGSALVSAEFRSMAHSSPGAFQSRGQKPLDNIEQRVQTFEILSKRQRFVRVMRRTAWIVFVLAVLAAAAYFAPTAWRMYQDMRAPDTAEAAPTPPPAPTAPLPAYTPRFTPGQTFRDCDNCPEMVVIGSGLFQMGSPATEAGRRPDESPQHEVSIRAFAIGVHEVTFGQWDACLADGGCNGFSPPDNGQGRGSRPVTGVSWQDAQSYLDWLNAETGGLRYRLATEAEWEYAARAGQQTAYSFGERLTTQQATFGVRRPNAVGALTANAFGVFDMHGNVAEWVEDCYAPNYAQAPLDGSAYADGLCARRVIRGGAFSDRAPALRAAARQSGRPDQRLATTGFRVASQLED